MIQKKDWFAVELGATRLNAKPLDDVMILVVEDDYLQASISSMALSESGANVLGPVADVEDARTLLDLYTPDCVVLDLRLRDEYTFLLADELRQRGIPTLLSTGYDPSVFPFSPVMHDCLIKPYSAEELIGAVEAIVERAEDPSAH